MTHAAGRTRIRHPSRPVAEVHDDALDGAPAGSGESQREADGLTDGRRCGRGCADCDAPRPDTTTDPVAIEVSPIASTTVAFTEYDPIAV